MKRLILHLCILLMFVSYTNCSNSNRVSNKSQDYGKLYQDYTDLQNTYSELYYQFQKIQTLMLSASG